MLAMAEKLGWSQQPKKSMSRIQSSCFVHDQFTKDPEPRELKTIVNEKSPGLGL